MCFTDAVTAFCPQDLRDQVGQLLDRIDSLSGLLKGADSKGQAELLPKRLKSATRKNKASPPSRPLLTRIGVSSGRNPSVNCLDAGDPDAEGVSSRQMPSGHDESPDKVCGQCGLHSTIALLCCTHSLFPLGKSFAAPNPLVRNTSAEVSGGWWDLIGRRSLNNHLHCISIAYS
jgi:hypothetical protein